MMNVRVALLAVFLVVGSALAYTFLSCDCNEKENLALEAYLEQDYRKAHALLEKLSNDTGDPKYDLYLAYVARQESNIHQSSQILLLAEKQAKDHKDKNLLFEISLNKILNAYIAGDTTAVANRLQQAKLLNTHSSWIGLFQAVQHLQEHAYSLALQKLKQARTALPLSPWMEHAFSHVFTRVWYEIKLARCYIEMGDYLQARTLLESEHKSVSPEKINETNLLMGMSYIIEADDLPPIEAIPYYKLAFAYINRLPFNEEEYTQDRSRMTRILVDRIHALIDQQAFQDIAFFASILQKWEATEKQEEVKGRLLMMMEQAITQENWNQVRKLTVVLNDVLPSGGARQLLTKTFKQLVLSSLQKGIFDNIEQYWGAARLFSERPHQLANHIANVTEGIIMRELMHDDDALTTTQAYYDFWYTAERGRRQRYGFAERLIEQAERLCMERYEEEKALAVLLLAAETPHQKDHHKILAKIEEVVNQFYAYARAHDFVELFPSIHNVVETLYLTNIAIVNDDLIARQVRDLKTAYAEKVYPFAKKKGEWILRVDSKNHEAHHVLGMIAYEAADYQKTLDHLRQVKELTLDSERALAVSEVLFGDRERGEKLLSQLQYKNQLTQDIYLRLGLGLLSHNELAKANYWLAKLPSDHPEANLALAYIACQKKEWNTVLDHVYSLQKPYVQMDIVLGMKIQALSGRGNLKEAHDLLEILLERPPEKPIDTLHQPFVLFQKKKLSLLNRYYVAALYYRDQAKNDLVALDYFQMIDHPTPIMQKEMATTLIALERFKEARYVLNQALGKEKNRTSRHYMQVLLTMSLIDMKLGHFSDAVIGFKEYFGLRPNLVNDRTMYATALMKIRRFDLALEQYRMLHQGHHQTHEDTLHFIECLVHLNKFTEANQWANRWINTDTAVPLVYQLRLAPAMIITRNVGYLSHVVKETAKCEELSCAEASAWIEYWMKRGEWERADQLIETHYAKLIEDPVGLNTLAHFHIACSNEEEGIKYSEKALELDPYNSSAIQFLRRHDQSTKTITKRLLKLKMDEVEGHHNLSVQVQYARVLMNKALDDQKTNPFCPLKNSLDLSRAHELLEKLAGEAQEMPRIHCFLGKTLFFLGRPLEAKQAFRRALLLDGSYVDAYLYSARVYKELGQDVTALEMLHQALQANPSHVGAWNLLATMEEERGNLNNASNAREQAEKFCSLK